MEPIELVFIMMISWLVCGLYFAFPTSPSTGKNGKVLMTTSDGALETAASMTLQTSYTYKGTIYTNRVYLLGTGKTLFNMRPAVEPSILLDAILEGLSCTSTGVDDEVQVSAGNIIVDGVVTAVAADTSITVTRPAATQGCWNMISVNKSTGAFTCTVGTDTTAGTGKTALLTTYGAAAGQKPLIPVADLLVAEISLTNGAAAVANSEITYTNREDDIIDKQILPNIGGVLLSQALVALHVGPATRVVSFTGYYQDNVLAEIGTAKEWSLDAQSNTVSENTMLRTISITETSGWNFTVSQLACDTKAKNNMLDRQGFCGIRLQYPNGGYWQSAATFTASFKNAPGALNSIDISGSLLDDPVFS